MKLRKFIISFISLMSVGAMFSASTSIANAASDDWYYPALGKAEDMPTKPETSQAPRVKKSLKTKKNLKKHAKKTTNKYIKKHVKAK